MKNLLLIIIIMAQMGCNPIDDPHSQEVLEYANECLEVLWKDAKLAEFNGLIDKSHRDLYEECASDFERKELKF